MNNRKQVQLMLNRAAGDDLISMPEGQQHWVFDVDVGTREGAAVIGALRLMVGIMIRSYSIEARDQLARVTVTHFKSS